MAEFHSLRGEFVTNLSKAGAHLPMAREMARHSTPDLTSNAYMHVTLWPTSRRINRSKLRVNGLICVYLALFVSHPTTDFRDAKTCPHRTGFIFIVDLFRVYG